MYLFLSFSLTYIFLEIIELKFFKNILKAIIFKNKLDDFPMNLDKIDKFFIKLLLGCNQPPYLIFDNQYQVFTTRFHSFTDGTIPSVYYQKFVGDFFTDVITDGIRPSALPSSVIPHSVGISVGKTKKPFIDGFTDGTCAPKKKDSRLKYTDGFLFCR